MYNGLTAKKANELLEKFGPNELKETSKITWLSILFRQIKSNFVIYLLTAAMIISFFVGKEITAYVLFGVILVVIGTGFIQEYKADKAVKALKKMLMHTSVVIRDGKEKEIDSTEIVPGDILILRTGEKIPADCIILQEKDLRVDESILTGESREVVKKALKGKNSVEENQIYMGTLIVFGKCTAKVIHTGMNTKFGKIANLISNIEKEMPLQKKVDLLAKYMAIIGFVSAILVGAIMLFRIETLDSFLITEILIVVIAVAVSSFPEGFPVVLTTALSLGAYRMAKKNAIVNRMSIIETLGETTVICSDKTGTITKGEMTVKNVFVNGQDINVSGAGYNANGDFSLKNKTIDPQKIKELDLILKSAIFCSDSTIEKVGDDHEYKSIGSPTESALLIMSAKAKLFREDLSFKRVEEISFTSERKMMSVLCKENNDFFVYSKGAIEMILPKCNFIQKNGKVVKLTENEKELLLMQNESYAKNALRTIAFAYKKNNSEKFVEEDELIFVGFVAMEDPPRVEVSEAIKDCYAAGIKVKMITGDNRETAISIAKQIGLANTNILEGKELDNITDYELARIVEDVTIFARVKPEHKLRIVKALKENGEIVTMTGDGVNDAPSLKEAHIGVAMGKNGTDVSRSVSDMILKDDNFASIVDAVKEGRTIFKNIQKFSSYQISINFAQVGLILLAVILGMPLPLVAMQILFINLFSDEILAIMLAFNPHSEKVMKVSPRKKSNILNKKLFSLIAIAGSVMIVFSLIGFFIAHTILNYSEEQSRTVVFLLMVFFGVANAFNFRSFRKLTLNRSPLVNKNLFYASIIVIFVTILVLITPTKVIFELQLIPMEIVGITMLVSLVIVVVFDVLKKFNEKHSYWNDLD